MPDSQKARKQLLDSIEQLIEAQDFEQLRELLADSRTSDVAEVVEVLDEIARQVLFDLLDAREAGEVLEKIDEATRHEVVEELSSDELGDMVATLPPDEAADVMADMSKKRTEEVLDQIPDEESVQIEKLLGYEEDTAGGIMNPEFVRIRVDQTIRDAIDALRRADPDDEFYHVFVVDHKGCFRGIVSAQTLLRYPRSTIISEVFDDDIPVVHIDDDQESVANTFRKNDLFVIPVVDKANRLLGRITVDDVVDVMDEEAEEDVMVMAGTHPDELDTHQPMKAAFVRLPWLLVCMTGALLSAIIFYPPFESLFEDFPNIESGRLWTLIIMFIPAIAAMGGNSGMQTSTVVVRGLATGDLVALKMSQVFARESRVAVIVAGACAIIAGIIATSFLYFNSDTEEIRNLAMILGLSVCISMFAAIMLSTMLGLGLPFFFRKVGIDPALSSGPLVTTANDIISFVSYFSLTLLLLSVFG